MNSPNSNDPTINQQREPLPPQSDSVPQHPEQIGRYKIERVLGEGGFGLVYLARDEELDRPVALKVPRANRTTCADAYFAEARMVANLDFPGIVPVYDVGRTETYPCYIVSKYVEGMDLSKRLKQSRMTYRESAELIAAVAESLHYAHTKDLVHRDIKPGNILVSSDGKPHVVDFGLALREENVGKGPRSAGTLAYMSPEQARGEGHRVNGCSDIFALGVVFYELLAGRRPFRGDTRPELLDQIISHEPKPLRQYDETIPKELQRICFKAMSKRAADRYSTAYDMAEDLRLFLSELSTKPGAMRSTENFSPRETFQTDPSPTKAVPPVTATPNKGSSDSAPIRIIPKGLRSFDAHDADFFLELLPGPRDRDGLPDNLRFWKLRIEETDPDETFAVGLIYGPSGCGKSSLVKAGLLPRLSKDVITVYIEATPEETETRLLNNIRKRCPGLEEKLNLKDTMVALRRGQGIPAGKKVLIVLDQFEQWMHSIKDQKETELVQALRQCDGAKTQCLVLVRDDFWLASSRLGSELEVDFVLGKNMSLIDLFDLEHAHKVLVAFGRAFGKLPNSGIGLNKDQNTFLRDSVEGLAQDKKVNCVRIALFAEMMKGKEWTSAVLKEVGGTRGIGVTFLEETFSAQTAAPKHRLHQTAARAVLRTFLPESGTDIKGEMKSRDELLLASGYTHRPKEFDDLIRILDSEIRLITPTDPEGASIGEPDASASGAVLSRPHTSSSVTNNPPVHAGGSPRYYQLTHDYLVASLREWLTRKQTETRKGRAELKLEERTSIWNAKRENKQLPTVTEWLTIWVLTDPKGWKALQKAMMLKAARVHGTFWGGLFLALLLLSAGIQQWVSGERRRNLADQTRAAAESLENNLGPSVPINLRELEKLPTDLVLPELESRFAITQNSRHKLSLAFALARYGKLDAGYLASRIEDIEEADTGNFVIALGSDPGNSLTAIKEAAFICIEKPSWRRKAKLAITAMTLGDPELALDVCAFENRPDPEQRTLFINEFPKWGVNLKVILDAANNSDSAALRSAVCLAAGQIPVEKVNDIDKESWKAVVSRWFVEHNDISTHSAAGWLLRQWQLAEPKIPDPSRIVAGRQWFVNTLGITMLQMSPGVSLQADATDIEGVDQDSKPMRQYWVSDREVTRGQFESFIHDPQYAATDKPAEWEGVDTRISPTTNHPVQTVSGHDALLYCNWLSQREGLKACYEKTAPNEKGPDGEKTQDSWRQVPESNGYRLLSAAEWEFISRAGTTTEFSSGDDEMMLADYCQMAPASKLTAVAGKKLPNAWGLYDTHGNVWEWCWDSSTGPQSGLVLRGGSWSSDAVLCRSAFVGTYSPTLRSINLGFRVALNSSIAEAEDAKQTTASLQSGQHTAAAK